MPDKIDMKQALNEKDGFQVWWRLLRPHTLTASFVPVSIGSVLAFIDGSFHFTLFFAMMLASILIQAATNMFNEYYDYARGLDTENSVGIGGTIVRDGIAPRVVLQLAFAFFGIAILLGLYITMTSSWWIAIIGLISMCVGYFYTGGPFPIAYTPLGEVVSGGLMGTGIIAISYFIQTSTITAEVIWISIPVAIFIGTIMLANNIRDLDGDKINGRKTIAILLGRQKAIYFLASLFIIAYGLTLLFIIIGTLPWISIIALLTSFKAIEVIKGFQGKTKPIEMLPAMVATGKTNTLYGFLLAFSLLLSSLF